MADHRGEELATAFATEENPAGRGDRTKVVDPAGLHPTESAKPLNPWVGAGDAVKTHGQGEGEDDSANIHGMVKRTCRYTFGTSGWDDAAGQAGIRRARATKLE